MGEIPPARQPDGSGFWYTLWTASKLVAALLICVPVAILMLTSTQPTVTPSATSSATPAGLPSTPTPGATPTSVPSPARPSDVVIPGHLFYVKGRTIYDLHGYDAPRVVTPGSDPAVSPDGRKLAYLLFTKNYTNLYIYDRSKARSTLLLDNSPTNPIDPRTASTAAAPNWSLDSSTIFFGYSNPGGENPDQAGYYDQTSLSVTSCPAGGPCGQSSARQLSRPTFQGGGDDEPTSRPIDPHTLVYTSYGYQSINGQSLSYGRLEALDPQSDTVLGYLSSAADSVLNPAWDPHGRYLAFVKRSSDFQHSSIYVMTFHPSALNGQDYDHQDYDHAHLLVPGTPFAGHPTFSPDGRYLAYVATASDGRFHLYIARVHLGGHPYIEAAQEVKRVAVVDSDRLAWAP